MKALARWRAKFKLLLMSPQPTVEVRQVFDQVAQLPMLENSRTAGRRAELHSRYPERILFYRLFLK